MEEDISVEKGWEKLREEGGRVKMHSRESGGGASQGTGPGIRTRQPTGLLTPTEWGEGGGQDVGRNFWSEEKLSRNESAKMDAGEGGKEEEEGDWF